MAAFQYADLQFSERLESDAYPPPNQAVQRMKMAGDGRPIIPKESKCCGSRSINVNADCQSINVSAPPAEVYRYCLRFEDVPEFIPPLRNLQRVSDTRFSWTSIVDGKEVKRDLIVMMRVPQRRIAWQAESDDFRIGVIFLDPLSGGGTKVTVKVRSTVEPVLLAGALRRYLGNFKRFVENRGSETKSR